MAISKTNGVVVVISLVVLVLVAIISFSNLLPKKISLSPASGSGYCDYEYTSSSVCLAWDASPDIGVVTYRLYMTTSPMTASGPPPRVSNSNQDVSARTICDSEGKCGPLCLGGLDGGVKHYFTVTALDRMGLESDYSNQLSFPDDPVIAVTAKMSACVTTTNSAGVKEYHTPFTYNVPCDSSGTWFIRYTTDLKSNWTDYSGATCGSSQTTIITLTAPIAFFSLEFRKIELGAPPVTSQYRSSNSTTNSTNKTR